MKKNYDIEINDSKEVMGGFLYTTGLVTKNQVAKEMEKLGREMMEYNSNIDYVSYSAWEANNNDIDNAEFVCVSLHRHGRKINVRVY